MQEVVVEAPLSFAIPDIAGDDSLAVAGYKALRHRYAQLGGRDAWTLTSLADATPMRIAQLDATVRRMRNDGRLFESGFRPKNIKPVLRHIRDLHAQLSRTHQSIAQLALLDDYVQRCDEDARAGLTPLMDAWQSQADERRVMLIASLNDDLHQEWLERMDVVSTGDATVAARPIDPGEPSHVRHIMRAAIEARLRDVRAFDTLPDAPTPDQIDALRQAIERLSYTAETLASAMPNGLPAQLIAACHAALDIYTPICSAHDAVENARRFATKQHMASNGPQTFADAQTRVIEASLLDWRKFLQPFL